MLIQDPRPPSEVEFAANRCELNNELSTFQAVSHFAVGLSEQ